MRKKFEFFFFLNYKKCIIFPRKKILNIFLIYNALLPMSEYVILNTIIGVELRERQENEGKGRKESHGGQ